MSPRLGTTMFFAQLLCFGVINDVVAGSIPIGSGNQCSVKKGVSEGGSPGHSSGGRPASPTSKGGDLVPRFVETFRSEVIVVDDKRSLRCTATGSPLPMITWTLDGLSLDARKADPRTQTLSRALWGDYVMFDEGQVVSHVNLTGNSVFDGGLFSCTAANSAGSVTHAAVLRVQGRTQVRPMQSRTATAGQSILLNCWTVGDEATTVEWFKDGRRVPFNHRQRVNKNGSLEISSLDKVIDSGNYSCSASSSSPSSSSLTGHKYQSQIAQQSMELLVKVPPVIEFFKFDGKLQAGMRTRVYCNVAQGDVPVRLAWTKDGCLITTGASGLPGLYLRQIDEFSLALVIENLATHHNGNYSCLAENEAAAVNHTSELLVNVPPSWLVEPRSLLVVEGSATTIDCMAQGFPVPQVTWKRLVHTSGDNSDKSKSSQYQLIRSGPHYQVYENGTLRISKSLLADRGSYLCQATNGVGPGLSTMVQLAVNIAARFESLDKQENLTVHKGRWLELSCQAYGDQPINIMWTRGATSTTATEKLGLGTDARYSFREEITSQGLLSRLNITAVSRADSVLFKCTASNTFGSDIKLLKVRVEEAPEPPLDLQLEPGAKTSRSVGLRWRQPYNGNSPMIDFVVRVRQERLLTGNGEKSEMSSERNVTVGGNASATVITHLQPATAYVFQAFARNVLGLSQPSNLVAVTTDEEAPGGPPTNVHLETLDATGLKVVWQAPRTDQANGLIKGYYIGYKIVNSSHHFVYKTVQSHSSNSSTSSSATATSSSSLSLALQGLQPFTHYVVIVQAFNGVGAGPRSDELKIRTGESGPSTPPADVRCLPLSSQSLKIHWDKMAPERANGFLRGYKVLYRPLFSSLYPRHLRSLVSGSSGESDPGLVFYDSKTEVVRADEARLILHGLAKFTNYSVKVSAFTAEDGPYSQDIVCRTNEDPPGAPEGIKVALVTRDSAVVSWREPLVPNGLVRSYTVYRKSWPEEEAVSFTVPDHTKSYTSSGLVKGKRYSFWVTASTGAGEGPATQIFTQTVTEIAPAALANFGGSVDGQTGGTVELACRAVGMPSPQTEWRLNGKPILRPGSGPGGGRSEEGPRSGQTLANGSLRLTGLLLEDEGNYSCHASNEHGSDSISYQVSVDRSSRALNEGEPPPPIVKIANATAKSITGEWKSKLSGLGPSSPTTLFLAPVAQEVYFKNLLPGSDWKQLVINEKGRQNGSFTISNLSCGSQYRLYVILVYVIGKSRPSQVIVAKTNGREPLASPASVFVSRLDQGAVQLNLDTWRNGGCPLIEGSVQWRNVHDKQWSTLAVSSLVEPVVLSGLSGEQTYKIRVTMKNSAGPTTVEYEARTSPFKISNVMHRGSSTSDSSEQHILLDSYNVSPSGGGGGGGDEEAALQGPLVVTSFVTLILLLAALLSVIVLYKTIQNKLVAHSSSIAGHDSIIRSAAANHHQSNTKVPFVLPNSSPNDFGGGRGAAELAVLTATLDRDRDRRKQKKLRTSASESAFNALTAMSSFVVGQQLPQHQQHHSEQLDRGLCEDRDERPLGGQPGDQEPPYQYLTVARTSFSRDKKTGHSSEYATVDKKLNLTKTTAKQTVPVSMGLGSSLASNPASNYHQQHPHQLQGPDQSPRYSTPKTPNSSMTPASLFLAEQGLELDSRTHQIALLSANSIGNVAGEHRESVFAGQALQLAQQGSNANYGPCCAFLKSPDGYTYATTNHPRLWEEKQRDFCRPSNQDHHDNVLFH